MITISRAAARDLAELLVHVVECDETPFAPAERAASLRTFLLDSAGPAEPKSHAARAILFSDDPMDREEWARESTSNTWRMLTPSTSGWGGSPQAIVWDELIERGLGKVEIWEPSS